MRKQLSKTRENIERLKVTLSPYMDVIIFMVTLFVANYFWKFTMLGDENGEVVTWLGMNVTAPFDILARHIAFVVYRLTSLFRDTVIMSDPYSVTFVTGGGSRIIWGCSGLKQGFIWLCLMLTVRGGWKHKLWFIPLGWLCCYLFNILRIFLITLLIEHHPDWFPFLHNYLFKYLFYGMFFGLWVWFVERIRGVVPSPEVEQTTV